MSNYSQGPGWWQASDGKWYPPQSEPEPAPGWGQPQYQQYQPYAPNYQVYGMGGPPVQPSVQGLAVASMVLGIVALPLVLCWILSVVCALVGLPLGLVALSKIRNGQAAPGPKGMAVAGVVCCTIALVLCAALLIWVYSDGGFSSSPY